jgi:peptide/nickel transport system substrate-binding protein
LRASGFKILENINKKQYGVQIRAGTTWLLSVFIIFMFFSCSTTQHKHADKTIFRYNEASGIVNLDPAFARDQAHLWVCNQLYNGLVQLDDSLNILPSIAKSFDISDDGLVYTFHLRDDVYFHESVIFEKGTRKVKASDFAFSFNRLLDPQTASPGSWVFGKVDKAGEGYAFFAENDSTFVIRLIQPFPPFLGILTMQYCSVIPHEAIETFGAGFRKKPIGTGPFYLKNWEENIKMVLRKNEQYFEKDAGNQLPYLDAVSISFLIDKMTAFLEFTNGNLDFISGIDPSYKDELLNRNGKLREKYIDQFDMIAIPYLNTEYFGILVDTSLTLVTESPLQIKAVRQAINYGFDREKMIHYLRNGIGIPGTKGMIPKGMPAYDESANYGYNFNSEKSKLLLSEAGFNAQNPVPPITLVTTSDYLDLCKFVQSQLQEVGFSIEIEVSPPAAVIERRAQSRVNFFRASWIADYPDEENYLSLFYSENFAPSGPNYTHFTSPVFDSLYRKATRIVSQKERIHLYRQMDSLVMEEAPVAVLYYDQALRFVQKNIIGMVANPINLLNLKKVKKVN